MKRFFVLQLLVVIALSTSGCAVARALNDEPGIDVNSVISGENSMGVQSLLGDPLREWSTSEGIVYRVYNYDGGYRANFSEASAMLFLDIISAGLTEFIILLVPDTFKPRHEKLQMAVAYDQHDHVVGVFADFSDFEELPKNGNPKERKPIPIKNSRSLEQQGIRG